MARALARLVLLAGAAASAMAPAAAETLFESRQLTPTVGRGRVFMPMHDPDVNLLTYPAFDPHSKQPSYKYAAVDVLAEGT